jgi:hypothetical protein
MTDDTFSVIVFLIITNIEAFVNSSLLNPTKQQQMTHFQ